MIVTMIFYLYILTVVLVAAMVVKGEFETTPVEKRANRALKRAVRNGLELGAATRGRRFARRDMLQACDAGPSQAVSSPAWA